MNDALIVGGGLAGAAVATVLAAAGRQVVVIERTHGPHDTMCGEFMSHEACTYLAALGVDLNALGALPIRALRLARRDSLTTVALPFPAMSLSRRVLDEALLGRAASAGATVIRGTRVESLSPSGDGRGYHAQLADGSGVSAQAAFLATGKHDLRGWKRPVGLQNDLLAFKMNLRLLPQQANALTRHVELALFSGGYAGLAPVEDGRANLCLLVRRRRFSELGLRWEHLLAAIRAESPHLNARLKGAEPCWDRPLALTSIPYGYVRRQPDGLFRLGDQAAVIPSFAGDGMSIALHSAALAAQTYLAGRDAGCFQRRLARDVSAQVLLATALSQGLVRQPTQMLLAAFAQTTPTLMRSIAARTRVDTSSLVRLQIAAEVCS